MPPLTDAHRGTGEGTPLVLIHGFSGNWAAWRPLLPELEDHHRVFAPTMPGHHGAAPLPEGMDFHDPEAGLDLLEAMLDAEGIDKAHLVGNSMGGALALELARRGRALSVVALSPGGSWDSEKTRQRLVKAFVIAGKLARVFDRPLTRRLMKKAWFRKLFLRNVMEHGDRVPPAAMLELFEAALGCEMYEEILELARNGEPFARWEPDVPVRIAWARRDRTLPFKRHGEPLLAAIPGAELVWLDGVGHAPMYDDPALINRTILEVTQRVDAERPVI